MTELKQCPLCGLEDPVAQWAAFPARLYIRCKRCGRFTADEEIQAGTASQQDGKLAAFLPSFTRQATERHQKVTLTIHNWEECARAHSQTTVASNLRRLLEIVGHRTPEPGARVQLDPATDYPLVDVQSKMAFRYLLAALGDAGLIEWTAETPGVKAVSLTPKGWGELQAGGAGFIPRRCFIAMWFDDSMAEAADSAFKAAISECGFDPVLMRDLPFNDDVSDRILAEIRLAEFLVADFTGNRAGVYFEAGFAKGLGRQVIFTCREDYMEQVHFDTNHFNHIAWKDAADLKEKLRDRIRATIAGSR